MEYTAKITKLLSQRKTIKPLLNKIYEQVGAFHLQQVKIDGIVKNIKESWKFYEAKKRQAEILKIKFDENFYQSLIDKKTEELLSCIKKLSINYNIDNSNKEKEKFAEKLLNSIYESDDVCEIPPKFQISGIGVFDIDLHFKIEHGYRVGMVNINLSIIFNENCVEINLGNYYFNDDGEKIFLSKIETSEIVDLIDYLIEQDKKNLKYVSYKRIAEVLRNFFYNKNITFRESKAVTTNTVYFIVNNMKIRVSDHERITNPSKTFTSNNPFFMERFLKAQERDIPSFDLVQGKYPNGEEYFIEEMQKIFEKT
ncbi:MAG: hypothetical protein KatS3mg035_1039 [Bacteroidia bacterium]|nr:MAG: hypothetical protein KatS3mg035_1039 [Bacteroidia bacterium]